MEELTSKEILLWRQETITRKVFARLEQKISEIQEILGTGGTLNRSSADETLANTAHEVGRIEGINEILNLGIE